MPAGDGGLQFAEDIGREFFWRKFSKAPRPFLTISPSIPVREDSAVTMSAIGMAPPVRRTPQVNHGRQRIRPGARVWPSLQGRRPDARGGWGRERAPWIPLTGDRECWRQRQREIDGITFDRSPASRPQAPRFWDSSYILNSLSHFGIYSPEVCPLPSREDGAETRHWITSLGGGPVGAPRGAERAAAVRPSPPVSRRSPSRST